MQANQQPTAQSKSANLVADLTKRERSANDFLSYKEIEEQYPGTIKAGTAAVWACTHRYGFHLLITMVGNKPRVRRDRWESFLESRTACNAAPNLASA